MSDHNGRCSLAGKQKKLGNNLGSSRLQYIEGGALGADLVE